AHEAWNLLEKFQSIATIYSYNAVVDAFSRKGEFQSALNIVAKAKERGLSPNFVTWMSILSPCRHHNELKVALQAFEEARKLDPTACAPYVVLGDVYKACGNIDDANVLREERVSRGIVKERGAVTTTIHGKAHTFHVNEIPPELGLAGPLIQAKPD